MAKKVINYEEDIFFLNLKLKSLKDGLKLDIDASFFMQKVKEDILFISNVINHIYRALTDNIHMLKRMEYMKSLQRLMQQFSSLLENIVHKRFVFAAALEDSFDEYKSICLNYDNNIRTIRNILADCDTAEPEQQTIVSQEEFKFLMFNEEESG